MSKLSRDQMRDYQRARRKRLGVNSLSGESSAPSPDVALEARVLGLEDAVTALRAEVALLKVVEETVAGMRPHPLSGPARPVPEDKTLFRRVVAEKERRLGG